MEARSLINRLGGFYELEESRIRTSWEQARWHAALMLNVYAKKGQRIKPKDLAVFPWEDDAKRPEVPKELVEAVFARWDDEIKAK